MTLVFWYMLVCSVYIMWLKQFKLWNVPAVGGNIVVVGALTCCALLYCMCDLKTVQLNLQCSLIWELMLYDFKLPHDVAEATKNICCAKGQGDHSAVTRRFEKFCSSCKNLDDQAGSGRFKAMDFKVVLQAIKANSASSKQRVSGELNISLSSVGYHFHDLSKNIQCCQIVPHVTKIWQNFDSPWCKVFRIFTS